MKWVNCMREGVNDEEHTTRKFIKCAGREISDGRELMGIWPLQVILLRLDNAP